MCLNGLFFNMWLPGWQCNCASVEPNISIKYAERKHVSLYRCLYCFVCFFDQKRLIAELRPAIVENRSVW